LPALIITSVTPNTANEGETVALTLSGVIPVATALSIAEADDDYLVTVNGTAATFRNGPGNAAVDAYVNGGSNAMYVNWTAGITTKATQNADVEISKIVSGNPVLLQTLPNAVVVTPTYSVSATAGANGTVTVNTAPNSGSNYIEGTDVSITATPASGFEFV